ncbi:MAG: hypothetical protein IT374_11260 [Polyangiaceae bacterium]|nr:hypothetical protein [Polyangiaceae bacterium]
MDPALRCEHDQDDNGLDDEVELELGRCLAPAFHFQTGHVEPPTRVLFNAHGRVPRGADGQALGPMELIFKYVYLWPRDDGFTLMDCWQKAKDECKYALLFPPAYATCLAEQAAFCELSCVENGHAGDAQSLEVRAALSYRPGRWSVAPLDASGFSAGVHPVLEFPGDRLQVYLSPGKHHFYASPAADATYGIGAAGYDCFDPHDGGSGPYVFDDLKPIPVEPREASFVDDAVPADTCSLCPSCCDGLPWANACARRGGVDAPSATFGTPDIGMPGCSLYDEHFCGGRDVGSPVAMIRWDRGEVDDVDGDGVPNAVDACPLWPQPVAEGPGSDGDHLPPECDPDPLHHNEYVGKGGVRSDGSVAKGTVATLSPGTPFAPKATLGGGYADFDGDNVADGSDLCPSLPGVKADVNVAAEWAETDWNQQGMALDLERASDAATARSMSAQTGYAHRANPCDPYPVSRTRASSNDSIDASAAYFCKGTVDIEVGTRSIPIETELYAGTSANEVAPQAGRTYLLGGQRCNCGDRGDCLRDQDDDCFWGNTRAGFPQHWRGWRPTYSSGCALDADEFCVAPPTETQRGVTAQVASRWDWAEERALFPDHFRPGGFELAPPTPQNPGGYWRSVDKFALGAIVQEGADFTSPPGALLAFHPGQSLYAEPDTGADGAALKIHVANTEESRRLRVSRFDALLAPAEPHTNAVPTGYCLPPWHGDLSFLDDPVLELGDGRQLLERGRRLVVGRAGARLGDVTVLDGAANLRRAVTPAPSVPSWLGDGEGAFSVVRGALDEPVSGGDTAMQRAPSPSLLWVERAEDAPARWAVLAATSQSETAVTYAVLREGVAPFLFSRAGLVVSDARAGTVAVVDPTSGLLASYDATSSQWAVHDSDLVRRTGASFVLDGATLLVAGGAVAGEATGAVALIDVRDGRGFVRGGFPARTRPVVTLARDSHVLILGGGVAADGQPRDDVWALDTTSPTSVAYQLRGATVGGALEAGRALLDVTLLTGAVSGIFQTSDGWTETRARVDGGWRDADASASRATCRRDDAQGGQLCALPGGDEWSSPGRVTCDSDSPPHACQGAPGDVRVTSTLPAPGTIDADLSADTLWTLGRRRAERRRLGLDLSTVSVDTIPLGARAHDVAAGQDGALIATDAGFAWIASRATNATLTPACGEVLRVASLGPRRWAGVTTVGIVAVSTESGAPVVTSQALLLPREGDDGLELTDVPAGAAGRLLCLASERALGRRAVERLAQSTSLEGIGTDSVLVGRGPMLARLRLGGDAFEVTGWLTIPEALDALRFDAAGQRAYGVTGHTERVFDLRGGGLRESPGAGVGAWIRRRDVGDTSLLLGPSLVRMARVSR